MKSKGGSFLFIFLLLIIGMIVTGWLFINTKNYDVSQLQTSQYSDALDNNYNVAFAAPKHDISIKKKNLTITISNNSDDLVTYGMDYQLEAFLEGKWYIIPLKKDCFFDLSKGMIKKHSETSFTIDLNMFNCYPGKHRIVKIVNLEKSEIDKEESDCHIILSLEFNLY